MKASMQSKDRTPNAMPKRYMQNPDGRTKKAYDYQPALLPWKCARCIGIRRMQMMDLEKGLDRLSAKEMNEFCFESKAQLDAHRHIGPLTKERPTRNRLHRIAQQKAAFGL